MGKRYLPFFPLKLVAFPGEQLNLHIFEPRYKQLINECVNEQKTFGIPVFEEGMKEFGAEMEVMDVVKRYPAGEMDISTRCIGTFQVFTFDEKAPGKLYAGGQIESIESFYDAEHEQWSALKVLAKELISILKMEEKLDVELISSSFELAHKLGLSLEQEYDMLQMTRESQRQHYMINHLERALPLIREMEGAKNRIKMNGHFQHHDPLNF
ncbi:LON peptidase substrate-binding domain-containing protein [Roseivirga sp.]|uniref:LON peptidase substrate-binding domain-containing protein n=1 Tax=Roseivirga sp. TaxID=1964215 RepID=UPI003B8D3750